MSEVILKNIHKSYSKGSNAVKNVSFEIKDKEFVVLVGPSGCGKTTILRMIAGLEEISDGEIFIDGKLVNKIPPKERDIAMVFQNYALYPHMTVFENMAFALKLRGQDKSAIKRKVESAAEILGLTGYLNRKPKELSGGQRQRTALGRAIVREPKVFLFDEPLSNLDAKLRIQMRTEISRLHKELGATIIYVTHDQVEAMTMGSKIVILNEGEIQQIGTPLEVYNKPANKFTAGFIGTPPMNFIQGSLQNNNNYKFVSTSGVLNIPIDINQYNALTDYADKNIYLGIRPEDIIITGGSGADISAAGVKIDLVEPLGSQTLLYFTIEGKTITAEIHGNHDLKKDQLITVKFNSSKLHFFDYQAGLKL